MASTYLTRTPSSETANGRRKWTLSFWIKWTSQTGGELFGAGTDAARTNNYHILDFSNSLKNLDFSGYESAQTFRLKTNRKFRDPNAWYHIVIAWDTTQATASDRIKIYVNGVQETSFLQSDYPSQNFQGKIFSSGKLHQIGGRTGGNVGCIMSHFHACEGYVYQPSDFGETDSTTGIWKPKTAPSVSYGTNGFFLKFENSASMGTDSSGQSNNFTVGGGTLTQTIDTPSNVFATFNGAFNTNLALANGNTKVSNSTTTWEYCMTTLGASAGKYYCELKADLGNGYNMLGAADLSYATSRDRNSYTHIGAGTGGVGLYYDGQKYIQGTNTNYAGSYTTNDIIGVALDMDNAKIYFSKNGVWANGSGGWGSSTFDSTVGAISLPTTGTYGFGASTRTGGAATLANFGNGYFGTTAVSSAGTNAGVGTFEYDVPSGFKALCTKNINAEEYS